MYSKCWFSLLQRVSHKTRLCNQITAVCTGALAFFLLYNIWVKVGSPVQKLDPSKSTFLDRIRHNGPTSLGPFSKAFFLAEFGGHNGRITCSRQYHIIHSEPVSCFQVILNSWSHVTLHEHVILFCLCPGACILGLKCLSKNAT